MGDSNCVLQSFPRASEEIQGGSVRALGQSVSFGRFKSETLHWERFSSFNQNRFLEEAQSFSKPGLVAQKKAFFEAHFKKIGAGSTLDSVKANKKAAPVPKKEVASRNHGDVCMDKTPNLVKAAESDIKHDVPALENDVGNENRGEHCMDKTPNVVKAAGLDSESDAPVLKNDVVIVNENLGEPCLYIESTKSKCGFSITTCASSLDHTEAEVCEDNSTILMGQCQDKLVIQSTQEPVAEFVMASTDDGEPSLTSPNTSTSVGKRAVQWHTKPKPLSLSMKNNNATENTTAFGSSTFNEKRLTSKSPHMSFDQDSCHSVSKKVMPPKKSISTKYPSNSVTLRDSKENSNQVFTASASQRRQATSSKTLITTRKSSAKHCLRSAPPHLKKENTIAQKNSTSLRNLADIVKPTPKPHHRSENCGSHVGEKEATTFLSRPNTTCSTHDPSNRVLRDTTNWPSDVSTFGRKLTTQSYAIPTPPLHPSGSRSTQRISAPTLSYVNSKKSLPKSVHMSVNLRTTVGEAERPTMAQRTRSSRNTMPTPTVSRESHNPLKASLQKSIRHSAVLQLGDRSRLGTAVSLIKPPPPTVFTPFRFRSDERAARRKEMLEEKLKVRAENPLQSKAPTITRKGRGTSKL